MRPPWRSGLFPLTPPGRYTHIRTQKTLCTAVQRPGWTSEVGFELAGPRVPQYEKTPRSDHSGSEPMGARQQALLWVWGDMPVLHVCSFSHPDD